MYPDRSLEALYETYGPDAKRLAYLLTGDTELAQDLVQEAFVRILGRFGNLRGPDHFGPYLRRTVVNLARRHWRRGALERALVARERRDPLVQPADGMPDIERRDSMWLALQALPPRQRAALVLRYYEDLSEEQVGAVLGCSLGAAKQLISRGLAALRAMMREDIQP